MPAKTKAKGAKTKAEAATCVLATVGMFDAHGAEPMVRFRDEAVDLKEAAELTEADYLPRGSTPLNDAVLRTIETLDGALKERPGAVHMGFLLDESYSMLGNRASVIESFNEFVREVRDEEPTGDGRVMMIVMTDGEENASTADSKEVHDAIKAKEADGWVFIYMGADHDVWAQSRGIGLGKAGQTFSYDSTPTGTAAATRTTSGLASHYVSSPTTYGAMASSLPSHVADPGGSGGGAGKATPYEGTDAAKRRARESLKKVTKAR